jgi:hypothetical protein
MGLFYLLPQHSTFLHKNLKFGPLEKNIKKKTSNKIKYFGSTVVYTLPDYKRIEEVFGIVERRTS